MTRDFIEINDFTVLVEIGESDTITTDGCRFEEPLIAVAFYGSGNVDLTVNYGTKQKQYNNTKGLVFSFYADDAVEFVHTISSNKSLECIVIATTLRNLDD